MDLDEFIAAISDKQTIKDQIIQRNLEDRRIVFNSEIDDDIFETFCLSILLWNQEDKDIPVSKRKPIYIYINSCGGELIMGSQLIGSIQQSITPVITVGFSFCASMSSYILAAGHKRYCFPNTVVLLHDGSIEYEMTTNKMKDTQKFYDDLADSFNDFWVENTNMTSEFLESIADREYYMFAQEAKERGLVDKIIGIDCKLDAIL